MLGTAIYDPHHMEGDIEESEGLGLVNSTTTMKDQKRHIKSHLMLRIYISLTVHFLVVNS